MFKSVVTPPKISKYLCALLNILQNDLSQSLSSSILDPNRSHFFAASLVETQHPYFGTIDAALTKYRLIDLNSATEPAQFGLPVLVLRPVVDLVPHEFE
jgi:hypothetical protein